MTEFRYSTYWRKNYRRLGLPPDTPTDHTRQVCVIYYDGTAAVTTWADETAEQRTEQIRLWLPIDTLNWPAQKVIRVEDEKGGY